MALINCSECGHSMSDRAQSCPNCGCPLVSNSQDIKKLCQSCKSAINDWDTRCISCGNLYVIFDEITGRFRKAYDWEYKTRAAYKAGSQVTKTKDGQVTKTRKPYSSIAKKIKDRDPIILIPSSLAILVSLVLFAWNELTPSSGKINSPKQLVRSCKSLYNALDHNKYTFEDKYTRSTPITVTGKISRFRKTWMTNEVTISLDGGWGGGSCIYNFPIESVDVKKLYKGKPMSLKCEYVSQGLGNVVLHNCKL